MVIAGSIDIAGLIAGFWIEGILANAVLYRKGCEEQECFLEYDKSILFVDFFSLYFCYYRGFQAQSSTLIDTNFMRATVTMGTMQNKKNY